MPCIRSVTSRIRKSKYHCLPLNLSRNTARFYPSAWHHLQRQRQSWGRERCHVTVGVVQARCRAGGARQADSSDGRLHRPGSSVGREAGYQSVQQEVIITGRQWSMAPYGDTENTLALPLCRAVSTGGVSYTVGGAAAPPTLSFATPTLCSATPTFGRFGDFLALKWWFFTLAMQICRIC